MLQYAWLNKDVTNEIKAYNNLAITYFNLSDLKNSKYYHERGFNMLLEPEGREFLSQVFPPSSFIRN